MTTITLEGFRNFFKYYKSEEHQMLAIEKLYADLPDELKEDNCEWITQYRTPIEKPEEPQAEPETKEGYVTAELMERLTNYPAKEFDSVFVNDCNRLFRETGFDICRAPAGALQISYQIISTIDLRNTVYVSVR